VWVFYRQQFPLPKSNENPAVCLRQFNANHQRKHQHSAKPKYYRNRHRTPPTVYKQGRNRLSHFFSRTKFGTCGHHCGNAGISSFREQFRMPGRTLQLDQTGGSCRCHRTDPGAEKAVVVFGQQRPAGLHLHPQALRQVLEDPQTASDQGRCLHPVTLFIA
jgi:hypothetical protein